MCCYTVDVLDCCQCVAIQSLGCFGLSPVCCYTVDIMDCRQCVAIQLMLWIVASVLLYS